MAKGPPCIIAGVCSNVCTKFGLNASFSKMVNASSAFNIFTVIGSFLLLYPIIILLILLFKSPKSSAKQNMAIISDATEISNPSILGTIFFSPDNPVSTFLSCLSFKSTHLFHVTSFISNSFP